MKCEFCDGELERDPLTGTMTCFVHPTREELAAINPVRAALGKAPLQPGDTAFTDRGSLEENV